MELGRRLEAEGVRVSYANDAELLLHAWRHWGERVLLEMTGFWAFVIYDKRTRRITMVRDQLGIKPLY